MVITGVDAESVRVPLRTVWTVARYVLPAVIDPKSETVSDHGLCEVPLQISATSVPKVVRLRVE